MVLDIAVATLIVTAVAVPLVGISIILAIYFQMNNRSNEMLRILAKDKLELSETIKDLDREVKAVDATFRKYTNDMSEYLNGQFQTVNNKMETLQTQVNNHSEALKGQSETIIRTLKAFEDLQGIIANVR